MNNKKFYEFYHGSRKKQKKIISKNDFTYHTLIGLFYKYRNNATKILDIGCGVGAVDLYFASLGKDVTGVDLSANAIRAAKENAKYLNVRNVKFKQLEFPNKRLKEKFDLVICTEVLEHIKDHVVAVRSIYKMLKDEGVVIASSPSKNSFLYKLKLLDRFDKDVGHLRRYSPVGMGRIFSVNGFEILEIVKTQGFLRDFLYVNPIGGQMLRLLKRFPFSTLVTFVDDVFAKCFGESDIYVVARKK